MLTEDVGKHWAEQKTKRDADFAAPASSHFCKHDCHGYIRIRDQRLFVLGTQGMLTDKHSTVAGPLTGRRGFESCHFPLERIHLIRKKIFLKTILVTHIRLFFRRHLLHSHVLPRFFLPFSSDFLTSYWHLLVFPFTLTFIYHFSYFASSLQFPVLFPCFVGPLAQSV